MASQPWRTEKQYRSRADLALAMAAIEAHMPDVEYHVCGSWRRDAERIGDLDVVIVTASGNLPARIPPMIVLDHRGPRLINGHLVDDDFHIDLYGCTPRERGAMLWFMTGPMPLNVAMRADAKRAGLLLNQYGLWLSDVQEDDGTEASIARVLDRRLGQIKWSRWLEPASRERWARPRSAAEVRLVEGSGGAIYEVKVEGHRSSCTCPGYRFRGECRHVKALRGS
jgi:DNA polymerase/3'-5' exonuclease PolX